MRAYEFFEDSNPTNSWELLDSASDKTQWGENLINLVQSAYSHTHLGSFVNSLSDVARSDWLVLDWDENNKQESAIFYRGPRPDEKWFGNKIQGIGHDGRAISKRKVLDKVQQLLRSNGWWIECSDAMAKVLNMSGLPPIKDEELLRSIFATDTLHVIDGNGHYSRKLTDGSSITEIVYGNPGIKR